MARTNLTRLPKSTPPAVAQAADAKALLDEQIDANAAYRSAGVPPDWLTTGLAGAGAGWVFGPVGALIGAAVSGIVSKRRRESVLAAATADAKTGAQLIDGGEAAVKRLESAAVTEQDKLEAAVVRDQFEQSRVLAQSPNPEIASAGFTSLLGIPGLVSKEADEIEAAGIAREQVARDQAQTQFNTFDNLHGDLQRESQRFISAQADWQGAQELIRNPSPTSDIALIYKMAKINDPGAIVTEGDAQVLRGSGSISDSMAAFYNQYLLGKATMSDDVRADMIATINKLYGTEREAQMQRNAKFQSIGDAAELNPEYMRVLRVQVDPREAPTIATTAQHTPSNPNSGIAPDPETTPNAVGPRVIDEGIGAQFANTLMTESKEFVEGVQRMAAGNQLVEENGVFTERDSQGNIIREVPRPNDAIPDLPEGAIGASIADFFGFSPEDIAERNRRSEERMRESPGLFQEGGFFDRRSERETN